MKNKYRVVELTTLVFFEVNGQTWRRMVGVITEHFLAQSVGFLCKDLNFILHLPHKNPISRLLFGCHLLSKPLNSIILFHLHFPDTGWAVRFVLQHSQKFNS